MGCQRNDRGRIDPKVRRLVVHRRIASTSRLRSSVGVVGADTTSPKTVQDSGRIDHPSARPTRASDQPRR